MTRRFVLTCCSLALWMSIASAQTNTNRILSIQHVNGTTKTAADIIQNVSYWYVNRQDCGFDVYPNAEAIDAALIRVSDTTANGNRLNQLAPQVWIGTNCNLGANRTSATNVTCTRAIGTTGGAMLSLANNTYTISLDALRPANTDHTSLDICNASSSGKLEFFIFSANVASGADASEYVYFALNGDMVAPTTATITTTSPSGDNAATIAYTSTTTIEAGATVEYFAVADGCVGPTTDAGVADAGGADGGASDGGVTTGTTRTAATYPTENQVPPVSAPGVLTGSVGLDGDGSLDTADLGLMANGDGATLGIAVRDAAGNYSVLSNIVCVRKIDTYSICDSAGGCPRGCSVGVGTRVSMVLVCAMVAAALALLRRRGFRP